MFSFLEAFLLASPCTAFFVISILLVFLIYVQINKWKNETVVNVAYTSNTMFSL